LYEWTLHVALNGRFEEMDDYFVKLNENTGKLVLRSVTELWKDVTKRLHDEGLLPGAIDSSDYHGSDWHRLIEFRNGLVHANASRPDVAGKPEFKRPEPSLEDLTATSPGWATRVVAERIKRLHKAAGTDPPPWLVEP
jgi:hypothetical protein